MKSLLSKVLAVALTALFTPAVCASLLEDTTNMKAIRLPGAIVCWKRYVESSGHILFERITAPRSPVKNIPPASIISLLRKGKERSYYSQEYFSLDTGGNIISGLVTIYSLDGYEHFSPQEQQSLSDRELCTSLVARLNTAHGKPLYAWPVSLEDPAQSLDISKILIPQKTKLVAYTAEQKTLKRDLQHALLYDPLIRLDSVLLKHSEPYCSNAVVFSAKALMTISSLSLLYLASSLKHLSNEAMIRLTLTITVVFFGDAYFLYRELSRKHPAALLGEEISDYQTVRAEAHYNALRRANTAFTAYQEQCDKDIHISQLFPDDGCEQKHFLKTKHLSKKPRALCQNYFWQDLPFLSEHSATHCPDTSLQNLENHPAKEQCKKHLDIWQSAIIEACFSHDIYDYLSPHWLKIWNSCIAGKTAEPEACIDILDQLKEPERQDLQALISLYRSAL